MRYIILVLLLCASGRFAFAEAISLDAFVEQVVEANPSLQASRSISDAQRQRVLPAFALDDPFFAAGVDEVPFSDASMGLVRYQLSLGIPFPLKLVARKQSAENRADESAAQVEIRRRELVVIATQAYLRACFNQKAIELNRDTYELIAGSIQSAKSRYKAGEGSHHEWLQSKIELSTLNIELAKLEREKRVIRAWMNELRNEAPETTLEIVPLDFDPKQRSGGNGNEVSLERQPELKALAAKIKTQQAERSLAGASFFPDFVLQGMAMHPFGNMDEPPKWGLMAGITLPLFFFQKQSPLRAAVTSELKAAKEKKRALENSLRTEIATAKLELSTAIDVVNLYLRDVIPLTDIGLQNATIGYAARRVPLTQLLDSLRTRRIQRLELHAAHIDVELAKLRLREILSAPPLLRFAPSRPSTIGGGGMPAMTTPSGITGIGRGVRKMETEEPGVEATSGATDSMGGM